MATTLYFYDLETSGFSPRDDRIMQFAGQRTDLALKPIDEPHNFLVKMTEDVVPSPDAILITGITPQKTIADGITEAEFLKLFHQEIATPGTVFVGFNTIRFDDEFMRFLHYRNFYDPYEWQYTDNKSRWDILDLVRMTRALRPDGIEWPFDASGKPANRLELLTSINKLDHGNAHDALSDVMATIAVARMIRQKQPKLFDFLFSMRDKQKIAQLVTSGQPFIYTSGKYASEFEKTTVVAMLSEHPNQNGAALVFDLRYDPTPFINLDPPALVEAWKKRKDMPGPRLPIKTLKYNRCPAVAPLSVLDEASQERLKLYPESFEANHKKLQKHKKKLSDLLEEAITIMDKKLQASLLEDEAEVDARLYEGFFDNTDRTKMSAVRAAEPNELAKLEIEFKDKRLGAMLPLYKARNFPKSLSEEEQITWERFRERRLMGGGAESRLARYFARLGELETGETLTGEQKYLLEELQLYGQSVVPTGLD
jgi:exodeoxyribonuclease-1